MNSRDYWKERFQQLEDASHKKGIEYCHMLDEQYRKAANELEKEIRSWYQRIAKNNNITITDAKKLLNKNELEEFKWSVDDYIKYGKQNAVDGKWMKQLENTSAKFHITRLEALKLHTQQAIEKLYGNQLDHIDKLMRNIYRDNMYHAAFEVQKGFQVGFNFAKVNEDKLNKIINKPWAVDGRNFSDRIWTNKTKLINEIHTELTQMCTLGKLPENSVKNIAKKMNVSLNRAKTLVMTEASYFQTISDHDTFKKLGVEQYEIVATLDSITSEICQEMDGKVFNMNEFEISTTAPPFHPNCRTVVVPYFDDEFDIGERAARNKTGKTYYIPDNMTYSQWKQKSVDKTLSASFNTQNNKVNSKLMGEIDFDINDKEAVKEMLQGFKDEYQNANVEYAMVMNNEKAYLIKGISGNVFFNMLPNKELYNAIVIHNHPKNETYFTFSLDDINFFLENKLSELYGFDHKYEYVMKPKEETIYELIHKPEYNSIRYKIHDGNNRIDISDEKLYHLVVKGISERYNFIYERKLRT